MVESGYIFRWATLNDAPFIAETIIEAEKSMTSNCGLAKYFGLSEADLKKYLINILEEEVDGCEFSINGFIIAEINNEPVSAMGGWMEGKNEDNLPSSLLKSNLISFCLPRENVTQSQSNAEYVKGLQIEREPGTYQLEYSYTKPEHRGHGLVGEIMRLHLSEAKKAGAKKAQLHVFENNKTVIKVHQRNGYKIVKRYISHSSKALDFFPYNVELLMEKEL